MLARGLKERIPEGFAFSEAEQFRDLDSRPG
jgi:hypothetical protein